MMNMKEIGSFLQAMRKKAGLSQAEMGERLGVTFQSVSNWERGESLPDTALLVDLARILDTSTDAILGGGTISWHYRRKITVSQMREAIDCIKRFGELLGRDHFMYRAVIDGLDKRMNSDIEPAFSDDLIYDAYVCEAMIECVKRGDYIDIDDIKDHIKSGKPKEWTLAFMAKHGLR